jgi:type IV pilus assembly protein PilX
MKTAIMRRQEGAVLVVSLLLLLVMTVLALSASQSTRIQERMAGNMRDMEMALQSAEASLRAAEAVLDTIEPIAKCTNNTDCVVKWDGVLPTDITNASDAWWASWATTFTEETHVASEPQYVIEYVAEVSRPGVGGPYLQVVREFHRATTRSPGLTDTAEAVLQSTHARVTFE